MGIFELEALLILYFQEPTIPQQNNRLFENPLFKLATVLHLWSEFLLIRSVNCPNGCSVLQTECSVASEDRRHWHFIVTRLDNVGYKNYDYIIEACYSKTLILMKFAR